MNDPHMQKLEAPSLSLILPVYNEAQLLERTLASIIEALARRNHPFEIILVENGSTDASPEICDRLAAEINGVVALHLATADYGLALQIGMLYAKKDLIVNFSVDWWDMQFLDDAASLMNERDFVIGIKTDDDSVDNRSFVRRYGSKVFQSLEKGLFSMPVRDTHGLKVARRTRVQPIARLCRFGQEVFETELILRSSRAGITFGELGLTIHELRPGRINILKRGLRALWHLSCFRLLLWLERFHLIAPNKLPDVPAAKTSKPLL